MRDTGKGSFDRFCEGLRITPRIAWELERVIVIDNGKGGLCPSLLSAKTLLEYQNYHDLYPFHVAERKLIKHREKLNKRNGV